MNNLKNIMTVSKYNLRKSARDFLFSFITTVSTLILLVCAIIWSMPQLAGLFLFAFAISVTTLIDSSLKYDQLRKKNPNIKLER